MVDWPSGLQLIEKGSKGKISCQKMTKVLYLNSLKAIFWPNIALKSQLFNFESNSDRIDTLGGPCV
jgi:hypothetical protein